MMKQKNLWLQMLGLMIYRCIVLCSLGFMAKSAILWAVGVGSLASSGYIVFTTPSSPNAQPKRIIGAYLIAIIISTLFHFGLTPLFNFTAQLHFFAHPHLFWMCASLSVGVTMILMVLLRCQHPPAAGISLVAVIDLNNSWIILGIMANVILLTLIKQCLKSQLEDLTLDHQTT